MIFKILSFFACCVSVFAEEIDLSRYEVSLYSQNGEDGVLGKIFQLIGVTSHYCVDCGAGDGITNSNTYFLRLQGWNGLSLDRSYDNPDYRLHKEFMTAENINQIFSRYNVFCNFDLLSIDVDYNTFYVWQALNEKYQPAVVVIAYNAIHLPDEDRVVIYHPFFCGDNTDYFGASIRALYQLGKSKGYSLVYAENSGANLFFIRNDILQDKAFTFKNMNDVEKMYKPATHEYGQDSKHREYSSSQEILK